MVGAAFSSWGGAMVGAAFSSWGPNLRRMSAGLAALSPRGPWNTLYLRPLAVVCSVAVQSGSSCDASCAVMSATLAAGATCCGATCCSTFSCTSFSCTSSCTSSCTCS